MKNTKLLLSALALVGVGGGISGCAPALAAGQSSAQPGPAASASAMTGTGPAAMTTTGSGSGMSTGPGRYILRSMPAGTVWIGRGAHGHVQARVDVFGLTPGSSHQVSIDGPAGHPVRFPVLTANSAGQADTTLTSVDTAAWLPSLSRFVIRLGDAPGDPLAAEPIAESGVLPPRPWAGTVSVFHAVTFAANGASLGQPVGQVTLSYDAAAQTLAVTVTAAGLNPGPHAAHIHLGSCQSQGPVKYMLADFLADANGAIVDQTRVVAGVTSVPGPGQWYLNLHQGGMNQILANGVPTLSFRPMLCTDITSLASAMASPATPATSPTGMPMSTPSMMPTGSPTPVSPASPSSMPTAQPTHY